MSDSSSTFPSADAAYRDVLSRLLKAERFEGTAEDRLKQGTREELNYTFLLSSPRDRLTEGLKLPVAVARFVWMMSANNRLADIAFYEPLVSAFTDDGLTVPGSSYGMRIRQPQPGLDQIEGVIRRLKADPRTRRAAVSIYQPIDATRDSKDIPCAFGIMFHARSGKLNATVIMRSNNAWSLLPFNIFEFTLIIEVVAVEAGLALGELTYMAGSMHLYERDVQKAEARVGGKVTPLAAMPEVPSDISPLDQLRKLGVLEAELRHTSSALSALTIPEWIDRFNSELSPYWAQLGLLLLCGAAARVGQPALDQVRPRLPSSYRSLVPDSSARNVSLSLTDSQAGPLFSGNADNVVHVLARPELLERFAKLAADWERTRGSVPAAQLLRAQRIVFEQLAARGDDILDADRFEKALSLAAT